MDTAALDARFDFCRSLAEEAGALALGYFERRTSLTVKTKGLQDFASEADMNVEILIRDRLKARFPEDAFLGEETGRNAVAGAPGIWVVDPIDGTQPFISGLPSWCVSIGYVHEGRIELGVVVAPVRREAYAGRRGHRSTLNGQPIAVSGSETLTEGLLGTGYSPRLRPEQFLPAFERLIRAGAVFYRDGSGALMLCSVACGRLIGYVEPHINSWDCVGAIAVIEGAGGRVSDMLAGDGLWSGNPIIAAPPALYPGLASLVGAI